MLPSLQTLQNSMKYTRNPQVRSKLQLFARALELKNVARACQEVGKRPRYYYYWWNRYRDSGFQREALQQLSRRPKTSPRQTPAEIVRLVTDFRKKHEDSPEVLVLRLEREKRIRVSKSTVYRILRREHVYPPRKRKRTPSSPKTPPDTVPGKKSVGDRFHIERVLGMGGGGIVYLAEDLLQKNKRIALKVLESRDGMASELVASLRNEFTTLSSLSHPNLAKVYDFGQSEREVYFSSEWIEGPNILEACRGANLNSVFALLIQILRALDYLHGRGLLHLDLKPDNILVTSSSGQPLVKLIDFGTAEWRKKGSVFQGEFVGTPPYASPEIILEHCPSSASDIYSLGMIFHQIFSGRLPFSSDDPFEMMKEQIYGETLVVEDMQAALPSEFKQLLRSMISKNARQRPQSPAEVLRAMNAALGENYSFRGKSAPLEILSGCDTLFQPEIFDELLHSLTAEKPEVICLAAPQRLGKSFLLRKLKAALQLRQIHPCLIEDSGALESYLEAPHGNEPLFLDFQKNFSGDWQLLVNRLENLNIPVLMTVPFRPSDDLHPHRWIELEPLSFQAIESFLSKEILDFPLEHTISVATLCRGLPEELETVLRAMQEESWIQWGDRGWRWVLAHEPVFACLLKNESARWEERYRQIYQILESSELALREDLLAGMLGLANGALQGHLARWVASGFIQSKDSKGGKEFFVTRHETSQTQVWESRSEQVLEKLYEQGRFQAGMQVAPSLIAKARSEKERVALSIRASRHAVAAGFPTQALQWLPPSASQDAYLEALREEIYGRANLNLARLTEAEAALNTAGLIYQSIQATRDLSRVRNLIGLLEKRRLNFAEAQAAFQNAIELGAKASDSYAEGLAWMNLGTLYFDQGQFESAKQAFDHAWSLEEKNPNPLLSCRLGESRLNFLYHSGKSAAAEQAAYDLLQLAFKHQDRNAQAVALNYLALLAGQEDQWSKQLQFLDQALAVLDPDAQRQAYFQTLSNRSYACLALKKYAAAQLDAEAALTLGEKAAQPSWLAIAHLCLGKVLRDRARPDLALATQHLNTAHQLIYENRIQQILWEVEFERGLLAKQKGETKRARNYFISSRRFLDAFLDTLSESLRRDFLRGRQVERLAAELATPLSEPPEDS